MDFETKQLGHAPDAIAPDGCEVRVLGRVGRASMAHFTLPPKAVSKAVAHHTIEEIWYFLSGYGKMWRRLGDQEEVVEVGPGLALTLPTGTHFQFRCDSPEPLTAVGATMPPWPGEGETFVVEGPWQATV